MKVRVETPDLRLGMYVSELDRPWIESPFLFQGFPIQSPDELEQLRTCCAYVYVDVEKTPIDVRAALLALPAVNPTAPLRQHEVTLKHDAQIQTEFKQELVRAKELRDNTRVYIDQVLEDVRLGASLDTQQAKQLVSELADSIVRNPDASVWLTHLKNRDEYTAIHSMNVCILSLSFGRALGLSKDELNVLGLGALLHDIGKMRVPLEVLNKPGRLTPEEFAVMKSHPTVGHELLSDDQHLDAQALDVILHHHERLNGRGYPHGLEADEIPYFTKIVAIVDVYDAISSDRVYHDGMTPHDALKNMYNWAPGNFDKALMEAFIRTIGIYPVGSVVEFVSGHVGVVVKLNEHSRLRPVVMLLLNRKKEPYPTRKFINLASPMWTDNAHALAIKRIADPKEFDVDVKMVLQAEAQPAHA